MPIDRDTIERVRQAAEIKDIVEPYVHFRRQTGANHFACCPFHSEGTPSFSVNPSMGIFKCFGCGIGGDVFEFIKQIEAVDFPDAVKLVAERVDMNVEEGDLDKSTRRTKLAAIMDHTQEFFLQGQDIAKTYYADRFQESTVETFALGFAPNEWDTLLQYVASYMQEHYSVEALETFMLMKEVGLAKNKNERFYSTLRGRVTFPIRNPYGQIVGFGARKYDEDEEGPKYYNTKTSDLYDKQKILYGLAPQKSMIRSRDSVVIVEGYTDVMSCYEAGVVAVASCGTSFTPKQADLVRRYVDEAVVMFDGDTAGRKASSRAVDVLTSKNVFPRVAWLPDDADPGDVDSPQDYVTKAHDFITHARWVADTYGDGPSAFRKAADVTSARLQDMTDVALRSACEEIVGEVFGKDVAESIDLVDISSVRRTESELAHTPSAMLIRQMLTQGPPAVERILSQTNRNLYAEKLRPIVDRIVKLYNDGDDITPTAVMGSDMAEVVTDILASPEPSGAWIDSTEDQKKAAHKACMVLWRRAIEAQMRQIRNALSRGNKDPKQAQREIMKLQEAQRKVSKGQSPI